MRKEIVRIGPLRLGIINAAVMAAAYLVIGVFGVVIGVIGGMHGGMGDFGMFGGGGLLSLALAALFGATFGFVAGVAGAAVYNLAAGMVGGVVIELRDA